MCALWLFDVFIQSSGVSTMSRMKSLSHQILGLFSMTRAVSKREGSGKSRLSGNLFKRACLLPLHSNCTRFGKFAIEMHMHFDIYRFIQALYSHGQRQAFRFPEVRHFVQIYRIRYVPFITVFNSVCYELVHISIQCLLSGFSPSWMEES